VTLRQGAFVAADEPVAPGRRRFVGGVGALFGGSALLRAAGAVAAPVNSQSSALNQQEMRTLIAVLGRLIPADPAGGGAVEAHVHIYIDRALATDYAKHLPTYRAGLAAVRALAAHEGAQTSAALEPAQLDVILTRMERGEAIEPPADSDQLATLTGGGKTFFDLLLQHTREGMFCDPIYGGNREFIGWELLGYPGVQLYYSDANQSVDEPSPGKNRSIVDFGRKKP
jgi:gluconate 2-dehydrogenase gamma chain